MIVCSVMMSIKWIFIFAVIFCFHVYDVETSEEIETNQIESNETTSEDDDVSLPAAVITAEFMNKWHKENRLNITDDDDSDDSEEEDTDEENDVKSQE